MSFSYEIKAPNVIHYKMGKNTYQVYLDELSCERKSDALLTAVVFKASSRHKDIVLPKEPSVVYVNSQVTTFDDILKIVIREIYNLFDKSVKNKSTSLIYGGHLANYKKVKGSRVLFKAPIGIIQDTCFVLKYDPRSLSPSNFTASVNHQSGSISLTKPKANPLSTSFGEMVVLFGGKIV